MSLIYLLLGTNLGNKEANINDSKEKLLDKGLKIFKESSIYETEPWGFEHPESFYNQVIKLVTFLSPNDLMDLLLKIENDQGRIRSQDTYEARIIDLDILLYDDLVMHSGKLIIPHPKMHLRRFVLEPLCEIAPLLIHPYFCKTVKQLLNECIDKKKVTKMQQT
jgi:2-amino-4-hydroxy-6-hydroxymethyldihydropteridine diphosphokinase